MSAFIEEHRERFGVEPICSTLEVSASAYYQRRTGQRSARAVEDERLLARIEEIHERNYCAYGYRRTWIALKLRAGRPHRSRVSIHQRRLHPGTRRPPRPRLGGLGRRRLRL